jgi:hypothetical protein
MSVDQSGKWIIVVSGLVCQRAAGLLTPLPGDTRMVARVVP